MAATSIGGSTVGWLGLVCAISACSSPPDVPTPAPADADPIVVPKIWDEQALATWATPVAGLGVAPGFVSEAEYYAAPVDNVRTYPVYHPRREPAGYRDWIKSQGQRRLIEPEKLHTRAEWIEAGRRVFMELDAPTFRTKDPVAIDYLSDAEALDRAGELVTAEGYLPLYRWVVGRDGSLAATALSCGSCHVRSDPEGLTVSGRANNLTGFTSPAFETMLAQDAARYPTKGEAFYAEFGVPWLENDIHRRFRSMPDTELEAVTDEMEDTSATDRILNLVFNRFNGSPYFTTRIADLLGVKDRRYLDATGTHANRGPEDIARYAILVAYADPGLFGPHRMAPPGPVTLRPPDEAMYALGLFLYSLPTLPSPHPFDAEAARGRQVFESEGCAECHTPPTYTNNKLVPVSGFEVSSASRANQRLHVSSRRVGTDPGLALQTRKGTGYYRVPTLRGLWYREIYEHSGSVASLEDWFDPHRLDDDYVPSGWKGPGVKTRAVPGHRFGLDLPPEDKRALIEFLKTL